MNKEYVISIDLGGTNVRVGIIDNNCEIIKVNREFTIKNNKEALANQICRMISELPYKDYNVKKVGICGFVHQSYIKYMKNLNISDFDLKSIIESNFPDLNVTIKNDAACTALSEAINGSSKDYENSFFITISSGIGGALINQKKLVNLHFEIGHMFVEYKHNTYEVELFKYLPISFPFF